MEILSMKTFYFVITLSLQISMGMAQIPPPMGPPLAGVADIPLQKIKFSSIVQLMETGLSTAVNNTNHQIINATASSGLKAKLSGQLMAIMPSYGETKFVTEPNQRVVQLQIKFGYTLSEINYHHATYAPRKLIQQILVTISCDKWNTDTGKSKITYTANMPHTDDADFGVAGLDKVINNTLALNIYNNLLHALSKNSKAGELPGAGHSCNCLSFKMGTGPVFNDGYAGFYYSPVRKIAVEKLYSNPTIRLLSIEQLTANDETKLLPGADMQVQYMANYDTDIVKLRGFKENEKILHRKKYDPIEFEHPNKYQQLIVLANLTVLDDAKQTLSGFIRFDKSQQYGAGLQKLIIMREAWTVVSPNTSDLESLKPQRTLLPAYELIFNIQYSKP